MNANPKFLATQAHVDEAAVQPFPGSRKVHLGPLRVPMREIVQTGDNPPILVYDTSGPYTDPAAKIDIRAGLPALREPWIERRDDTEVLEGPSEPERLPSQLIHPVNGKLSWILDSGAAGMG